MSSLVKNYDKPYSLESIIENKVSDEYLVPDKMLRKANIFDICYKNSTRSCCFTKAYSHYVEGTGSVFTNATSDMVDECFKMANTFQNGSDEFITVIKSLRIRFFTPKEVLSLMAFPKSYTFPTGVSRKQHYRLLGNSVNIKVISELLKILFDEKKL